ncbi:MAG: hypothetical protein JWL62_967, partial [Hyphomicrobiales bacterium]|nr:hypothetical protein [Hyphomicrobiales bacterium]
MSKILNFRPAVGPPRCAAPPGGPCAEILFFTG